jgi:hypothetical protein
VPQGQRWVLGFNGFRADEGGQGEGKLGEVLWSRRLGEGNKRGRLVQCPCGGKEGGPVNVHSAREGADKARHWRRRAAVGAVPA